MTPTFDSFCFFGKKFADDNGFFFWVFTEKNLCTAGFLCGKIPHPVVHVPPMRWFLSKSTPLQPSLHEGLVRRAAARQLETSKDRRMNGQPLQGFAKGSLPSRTHLSGSTFFSFVRVTTIHFDRGVYPGVGFCCDGATVALPGHSLAPSSSIFSLRTAIKATPTKAAHIIDWAFHSYSPTPS